VRDLDDDDGDSGSQSPVSAGHAGVSERMAHLAS
jgi:hypothetical protein